MIALSDNLKGSLYMSLSMAGFGINDGLMKLAFEDLPMAQSIAFRGAVATIILAILAWRGNAFKTWPTRRDTGFLTIRTIAEVGGTATFLLAIANMPIADATAVLQATPLAVTVAAAIVFREAVGWRRWSAIIAGFLGVIIMMRPGTDGFTYWALLPVATVLFITLRDLVTRAMSDELPAAFASTITAATITLIALLLIPVDGWVNPSPRELVIVVLAGAFIVAGYLFAVSSMRVGDVSAVSPFRYTVLIWALIVGFLFFGEVPDVFTVTGAALVTTAGLYTLWREHVRGTDRSAARAPVHTMDAPRLAGQGQPDSVTPPDAAPLVHATHRDAAR